MKVLHLSALTLKNCLDEIPVLLAQEKVNDLLGSEKIFLWKRLKSYRRN